MKFAIIAAGEGSRLAQEGVEEPKPLVSVCGQPMIERLMRIFVDCGASEIVVIINEQSTSVHRYLKSLNLPVPLKIIVKTTPSSMHSLHALSPYLRGERFCLTTVDTIFREEEFKKYIRHFERVKDLDGCMAVTPYVDDEKPLWVGVKEQTGAEGESLIDQQGYRCKPLITGFHDQCEGDDHLISGGIYCLGDKALDVLDHCMEQGMSRMRNFQRQLVAEGLRLEAYPIDKILDVDHKEDIPKARKFLLPLEGKAVDGIMRDSSFSPNCVNSDAAIFEAVSKQLEALGAKVYPYSEYSYDEQFRNFKDLDEYADLKKQVWLKNNMAGYFSMARSSSALQELMVAMLNDLPGLNSPMGVMKCVRWEMTSLLMDYGIPMPKSKIVRSYDGLGDWDIYPCWLKRGDACAQQKEDTCYVETREEAEKVLLSFRERNISFVVLNEHLKGDLVKFYGVEGTDFFYWFYPSKCGHRSKFGLEAINGDAQGIPFVVEDLKKTADRTAKVLETPIYGGDCIIAEDGSFRIIDFNDWPSFAPCRDAAAYYIAKRLCMEFEKHPFIKDVADFEEVE